MIFKTWVNPCITSKAVGHSGHSNKAIRYIMGNKFDQMYVT